MNLVQPLLVMTFDSAPIGELFDDLLSYDTSRMVWTSFEDSFQNATRPSHRREHGFTSVGSRLYVFGGIGYGGNGLLMIYIETVFQIT